MPAGVDACRRAGSSPSAPRSWSHPSSRGRGTTGSASAAAARTPSSRWPVRDERVGHERGAGESGRDRCTRPWRRSWRAGRRRAAAGRVSRRSNTMARAYAVADSFTTRPASVTYSRRNAARTRSASAAKCAASAVRARAARPSSATLRGSSCEVGGCHEVAVGLAARRVVRSGASGSSQSPNWNPVAHSAVLVQRAARHCVDRTPSCDAYARRRIVEVAVRLVQRPGQARPRHPPTAPSATMASRARRARPTARTPSRAARRRGPRATSRAPRASRRGTPPSGRRR